MSYIEREAVKEAILSWAVCINHPELLSKEDALHCIDYLPAADVAEVRHGRWFFKYPNGWACSRCGEWGLMIDNRGICKSSYCPNCGALMKEADHD